MPPARLSVREVAALVAATEAEVAASRPLGIGIPGCISPATG